MSRFVARNRIALAVVAVVCAVAWVRPSLEARTSQMNGGTAGGVDAGANQGEMPVPRIYFQAPYSADRDRVRSKLQQKMPMKFANEMPLADFLKAVQAATVDKEMPGGVPIYVDPVGLQEAEKTMTSPVAIDLDSVRIETGLRLVLKQLDLVFDIHPDGLLFITSKTSEGADVVPDPNALILDKLEAIQREVGRLHAELRHEPVTGVR